MSRDLGATLAGADVVVSAVPGAAILGMAEACAPLLEPGAVYVEVASSAPERKQHASSLVALRSENYVDAAVMGTVLNMGLTVPILASGPGAARWARMFAPFGVDITVLSGPVGDAARVKLLRSVYMKGRDALVVEMVEAARRYGLEEQVIKTVPGSPSETSSQMVERVLQALERHGTRRADELQDVSDILQQVDVLPRMTTAAEATLRAYTASATPSKGSQDRGRDGELSTGD
jgi:3-hydroxyisobutyrate dehydrogenase-like beta-hydroxyacid dehydrogenase